MSKINISLENLKIVIAIEISIDIENVRNTRHRNHRRTIQ